MPQEAPPSSLTPTPETVAGLILHRDAMMLILDKPFGIPVHRGPKAADYAGPALDSLFEHLRFGLPRAPELAHRLDRDTSGCLVLGRHRAALERLGALFKRGEVDKTYVAVVHGAPETDEGLIDLPLGRKDPTRGWWMKVDPAGLPSRTRWRLLGSGVDDAGAPIAALALEPLSGRTHQLRVHCAAMGWPIVGDAVYGAAPRFAGPGLHLHARRIVVPFDPKKPAVVAQAPFPPHMRSRLAACGVDARDSPPV